MADYAYAFSPAGTTTTTPGGYYQPPPTQWDTMMTMAPHATSFVGQQQPATQSPSPPSSQPTASTTNTIRNGQHAHTASGSLPAPQPAPQPVPASLLWTSLEAWMDEEYGRQVCSLLGWDARVRVPPADNANNNGAGAGTTTTGPGGTRANNAGYAILTFTAVEKAAAALAQVSAPTSPSGTTMTMPNSSRTFEMRWAPAGMSASTNGTTTTGPPVSSTYRPGVVSPTSPLSPTSASSGHTQQPSVYGYNGYASTTSTSIPATPSAAAPPSSAPVAQAYPKEYSIFVGDLAPETSNSDLVAVFRNPVLGLRNDRAPKFIRPFTSCKSAKIMLDPATGVSRGYGFVRFTDETDQQRALIEMHGLYCLSRPMRISPATAKFKPPSAAEAGAAGGYVPSSTSLPDAAAVAGGVGTMPPSVSAPIAGAGYYGQPALSTTANAYYPPPPNSISVSQPAPNVPPAVPTTIPAITDPATEWKHHAHARAILGNLIGPNGEQLTSTDPYNTTVFVGGLSPLVGEDTLRTFFVPFGEIHYVKVPVGKHCGFVQFVRKADAEQAIEKMQGFPVGGSRIRLSWGRSQYKAAQAAAQAAQAAALQNVAPSAPITAVAPPATAAAPVSAAGFTPQMLAGMTQEQIVLLLEKFGPQALFGSATTAPSSTSTTTATNPYNPSPTAPVPNPYHTQTPPDPYRGYNASPNSTGAGTTTTTPGTVPTYTDEALKPRRDDGPFSFPPQRTAYDIAPSSSSFSPFSPDPNQHTHHQPQGLQQSMYAPPPPPTLPPLPMDMLGMRRDSYAGLKSYVPSPTWTTTATSGGGGHGSPTRGYTSGGSPPAFQVNLATTAATTRQPISRPNSGSAVPKPPAPASAEQGWERDVLLQDLNGTLASLDLGGSPSVGSASTSASRWGGLGAGIGLPAGFGGMGLGPGLPPKARSPASEESAASASASSSGASVQFRMTPSPP
uniref:RRM domain-containing protein n=1 Tax=Mycena chlorophos TaxID=658473 RepID=A0ABQ0LT98_MYCCL|nr:predicted protein [Mycena chlorophos]